MKRVPAEWEPQRAVWIAWPHNRETWPQRFGPIRERFRQLIALISESVDVHVLGASHLQADAGLNGMKRVHWFDVPTDDCWVRDYGPTFVTQESDGEILQRIAIDWRYNAWGGKYPPWDRDDAATERMLCDSDWVRRRADLCVEGGALEWDGTGRLLTTPDCLVTDTRNPGRSKTQIEGVLRDLCGAREIVWVDGGGLQGDDTDGHIDQLARWISPTQLVVAVCDDAEDPNHGPLDANFKQLQAWARTTAPSVDVYRLPIPPARSIDGQRVPESYCNFLYLGPNRLLLPTFQSTKSDDAALTLLRGLLPNVEITPVDCHDLAWGLGALHCASRDEPAFPA